MGLLAQTLWACAFSQLSTPLTFSKVSFLAPHLYFLLFFPQCSLWSGILETGSFTRSFQDSDHCPYHSYCISGLERYSESVFISHLTWLLYSLEGLHWAEPPCRWEGHLSVPCPRAFTHCRLYPFFPPVLTCCKTVPSPTSWVTSQPGRTPHQAVNWIVCSGGEMPHQATFYCDQELLGHQDRSKLSDKT